MVGRVQSERGSQSGGSPNGEGELEIAKSAETGSKFGLSLGPPVASSSQISKNKLPQAPYNLLLTIWRKKQINIAYQFSGGLCTDLVPLTPNRKLANFQKVLPLQPLDAKI